MSSHCSSSNSLFTSHDDPLSLFSILGLRMNCWGFRLAPRRSALLCCMLSQEPSFPFGFDFSAVRYLSLLPDPTSSMAFQETFEPGSLGGSGGGCESSPGGMQAASKGTSGTAQELVTKTACWRGGSTGGWLSSAPLLGFGTSSLSSEFLKEFTGCGDKLLDQPLSLETTYVYYRIFQHIQSI